MLKARILLLALVTATTPTGLVWAQGTALRTEQTEVFLNEHQVFEPGYAVGNIAIGNAGVADYKVMPGRRQLLIFGKGVGNTSLTIWDQSNVKRHEILINVMTREDAQAASDLRDLLRDYPKVEVRRLRGGLVVTGTVDTEQDLQLVQKTAEAGRAQSLVRVAPPLSKARPAAATSAPVAAPSAPAPPAPAPPPAAPPAAVAAATASVAAAPTMARGPAVTYQVELIEASSKFRTGSYNVGIQPSGPSLFKGEVNTVPGEEGTIFIPATAAMAKDPKKAPKGDAGIRLKVRPTAPDARGLFVTQVIVETNLPVDGASDPSIWRQGRWEFPVMADSPFGIAGPDLLAISDPGQGTGYGSTESQIGRVAGTTSTVAGLPGVSSVPAVGAGSAVTSAVRELFGVWGSSHKEPPPTQLLVVLRPHLGPAEGGKR